MSHAVETLPPETTPSRSNPPLFWVLWRKLWGDACLQLVASSILLFSFGWIFVWVVGQLKPGAWSAILKLMPNFMLPIFGVPINELASLNSHLSMLYLDVVVLVTCIAWAIGRGSDPISGELGRGTLEMLLAQPIRRVTWLSLHLSVSILGGVLLAASLIVGQTLGIFMIELPEKIDPLYYLPAAMNLACLTVCVLGITTLFSAWEVERWRTIGLMTGFYIVSLIMKVVGRLWEPGEWLHYFTFLTAYEPQILVLRQAEGWGMVFSHCGILLGIGLVCMTLALIIFHKRDLPAPL
ncbi:Hypothetical protein PBC10988_10810 [Planctomycetales bacterium 10988]|nr:Hypothetical protein PBC10988_10810 [Planctomycetales bacterium 10988]